MDVVMLSRIQFAVATYFHYLFVPLTLGLAVLIAIWETKYVRTGDEEYKRMARYWGKIFLLNFGLGVVTGITLEFQFGTNWAGYSRFVGDVFGSLLAIEATVAFFLESTLIGVWWFGWRRLSAKAHALVMWGIVLGSSMSAYWIIMANAWMQHPVGYVIRNGRAELTDFWAVITQQSAIVSYLHVLCGAFLVGGFLVMGVCAYHLLRKQNVSFFTKSFRTASVFTLVFALATAVVGDIHGKEMAKNQPAKLAAAEGLWETQKGVPFYLIAVPDEANERNRVEWLGIPKFMSWLAYGDWNAEVRGLKSFPEDERPPVAVTFWAFRFMVGLGFLFILLSFVAVLKRNRLDNNPRLLKTLMLVIPLPYLANLLGWTVTEVGRQPWIVYGVLKTGQAASPIAVSQVGISLVAFIVLYSLLGLTCFYLMYKYAIKGPDEVKNDTGPEKPAAINDGRGLGLKEPVADST